jgi:iron complex outermembrane recepter protein
MSIRNQPKFKRSRLSAAMFAAMLLPATGMAVAQQTAEDQDSRRTQTADASTLDRVQVTGSRIKRVQVEGPSPVTIITAD